MWLFGKRLYGRDSLACGEWLVAVRWFQRSTEMHAAVLILAGFLADPEKLTVAEQERLYVIAVDAARRQKLSELSRDLLLRQREAKKGRPKARAAAKGEVASIKAQMSALEDLSIIPEPPFPVKLSVGALGRWKTTLTIVRITGKSSVLARTPAGETLLLAGFPTAGMVVAKDTPFDELAVVTETKTSRRPVGGANTAFVVRPLQVDPDRVRKALQPTGELKNAPVASSRSSTDETDTAERSRKARLANARKLARDRLYASAEKMLRQIITEAPGTPIAAEAQKDLDNLPPH
jgi:hypothetical protein